MKKPVVQTEVASAVFVPPKKNIDITNPNIPLVNTASLRKAADDAAAASLRSFENLEELIMKGQRTYAIHGVQNGETVRILQCTQTVKAMRAFGFTAGAGQFSVDVVTTPTGREAEYSTIGTITKASPSVVAIGPFGIGLGIVVRSAPAVTGVDVFLLFQEDYHG